MLVFTHQEPPNRWVFVPLGLRFDREVLQPGLRVADRFQPCQEPGEQYVNIHVDIQGWKQLCVFGWEGGIQVVGGKNSTKLEQTQRWGKSTKRRIRNGFDMRQYSWGFF